MKKSPTQASSANHEHECQLEKDVPLSGVREKIDCENEGKRKLNIYLAPQYRIHHSFPKNEKK